MERLRRSLLVLFAVGLGASITLSQASLAALTLLWLWGLRDPARRVAVRLPLLGPVLAFVVATLASAMASAEPLTSLVASKGLLLALALWVTADLLSGRGEALRWLGLLALVATVAAAVGVAQVAFCPGELERGTLGRWFFHRCDRARGFFSIYMTLAGILTLVLLATLPRLLPGAPRRRWFIPLWLIMLGGLIASYTRGAWLGFAAGVLALLPASRRGRVILVGGLAALVLGLLVGPPGLRQRFVSMGDPEEATVKERRYMWESGLMMARERPWLGFGPGGVKRGYRAFALEEAHKKRLGHVHNTPLQILVERGVIGLAAWLWIWVAFYVYAIGVLRRLAPDAVAARTVVIGSVAAVTGFLVGGLSEYNFGDSEVAMVAWAIAALPWVVARDPAATAREPELSTLRTARSTSGP